MDDLNILYEDRDIIVVVKPVGVDSQSSQGLSPDMVSMIKNHLSDGSSEPYVGVVHRLDRPTSGIMVFAKTKEAAAALSKQIQEGSMDKTYLAAICGQLKGDSGRLEDYLAQDDKTNLSRVVTSKDKGAKKAVLEYQVLKKKYIEGERISLVRVHLLTGRHHQIRVQMAHAGTPLIGDHKYNPIFNRVDDKGKNIRPDGFFGKDMCTSLALCSSTLTFTHPKSRKKMHYSIEPEGELWSIFK